MNKLAGRHNISKNWDTDSGSEEEEEEEEEEVAETGSKGSMNRPAQPSSSSRVQSDAETEHSSHRQRPRLQSDQDSKATKRLLDGHKR